MAYQLDLKRKISPHPIFDAEIINTIPAVGTGTGFSFRQALLLLRLSLRDRHIRANSIWDSKGRSNSPFKRWYQLLTDVELATVGLTLKPANATGRREYMDASRTAAAAQLQPPGFVAQAVASGGGDSGSEEEEDGSEEEDPIDDDDHDDPVASIENLEIDVALERDPQKVIAKNKTDEEDEQPGPEHVKGADLTLSLLGSDLDAKIDSKGTMRVSIGWLHDLDGPVAKLDLAEGSYCGCMLTDEDEESEGSEEENDDEEDNHFVDLLLDTNSITLTKFLRHLDDAATKAFPNARWNNLKLHEVELSGWNKNDDWKAMLKDKFGETMTERQIEDLSADMEYMQIFVGYEYVSEETAQAARTAWSSDL